MGSVANTVKNVTTTVGKGSSITGGLGNANLIKRFAHNSVQNVSVGCCQCPIVCQCRDVVTGIAQGDFQKIGFNAGVLALGTGGSSVGKTAQSATTTARIVALSGVSQVQSSAKQLQNGQSRSFANYVAHDWMFEEERDLCNILSSEPTGLEDIQGVGRLNFGQLLRDCRLCCIRDKDNGVVPLTTHKVETQHEGVTRIQYGQHEGDKVRGLGRITWITKEYDLIWEGQIFYNDLDGFARTMKFLKDGRYESYMGNWEKGVHHGYGRLTDVTGTTYEGLFEKGKFIKSGEVTTYDQYDPRATEVDYVKYLITNDDESFDIDL